jgi:hypothetical protein
VTVAKLEDPEVAADGIERFVSRNIRRRRRTRRNRAGLGPTLEVRLHDTRISQVPALIPLLRAFVLERHPFALPIVERALEDVTAPDTDRESAAIEQFAQRVRLALRQAISGLSAAAIPETTPGVTAQTRLKAATQELLEDVDGFFARAAIAASLTPDERREILRGMVLTRAVDNRLKQLFTGSEVQFEGVPFQGKGFRSLGQEAIYAAAIRLRRGEVWRDRLRGWRGDVVGPIIRDLGVALAMHPEPSTVRMVLNAQMAKLGPPMDGKDLHIGDWEWGILPAAAPLSVSTMSIAGIALAFWRDGSRRVALSFIGDGGSSLGEWHEAINLCAATSSGSVPSIVIPGMP